MSANGALWQNAALGRKITTKSNVHVMYSLFDFISDRGEGIKFTAIVQDVSHTLLTSDIVLKFILYHIFK